MNCRFIGFNSAYTLTNLFIEGLSFSRHFIFLSIFVFLPFCGSKILGQVEKHFNFEWNVTQDAFVLDGLSSPTLSLFEHCYYLIQAEGAVLSITEQNNSLYNGEDLFQNSIMGDGEYMLFNPNENTPRFLKYQNLENTAIQGDIVIQSFEEKSVLKFVDSTDGAKFGSKVTIANDLSIFASAPGYNNNEGLIVKFKQNNDGNYSYDYNISSPIAESVFWGSSLFYNDATSSLLIGFPSASNYRGTLYNFSSLTGALTKVSEGASAGNMFGWSAFSDSGKIFAGSLSVLDSQGGYVSVFDSSSNPPSFLQTLRSTIGQFGNEFGYALSSYNKFLLIGAPGEDDLITEDSGSVYLFKLEDNLVNSLRVSTSSRNNGDRFGHTVAINPEFIFVGAPYGDGLISNSGVVSVFKYNSEDLTVEEVFKILPPTQESGIEFGHNLLVQGDFVFVSSLGSDHRKGTVDVYKKSTSEHSWSHVKTISLGQFSTNLSSPDNIDLASKLGILAIGLEGDSSTNTDTGAVKVLYNPAWHSSEIPQLPPFFENNDILEVNVTEDQTFPLVIDFNSSSLSVYSDQIRWDINSADGKISEEYFEINPTSGKFTLQLPKDFFGELTFEVSTSSEDQSHAHLFVVKVDQVQDLPNFFDFNLTEDPILLPDAAVNENYDYTFNVFDADGESLSLVLLEGQLPTGLSIDGLSIIGAPSSEGNFSFSLGLTDGSDQIDQSFNIEVFSANSEPEGFFNGNRILNAGSLTLEFSENFSLTNWENELSALTISDPDSDLISIEVMEYPENGYLLVSEQFTTFDINLIRYTPKFNFSGTDSFSLRFKDNHPTIPKYYNLTFNLLIQSLNSSPIVTSVDPPSSVLEGNFFEHDFEIFDAEEDYYTVSFQNLPSWLSFDGVRRIFGKPKQSDFTDQISPFFISITDQWGSTYTQKLEIGVTPQNYPPILSYLDDNISKLNFQLEEDSTSLEFTLNANDPDNSASSLVWTVSTHSQHGEILIIDSESTVSTFSYNPDGNFSGIDFVEITVAEESDAIASDQIRVEFNVIPKQDPPKFESKPFSGLLVNKPWIYQIRGIDADTSDVLTLQSLINLPVWLKLTQTGQRTWTFRGQPSTIGEEVEVALRLSDQQITVDQNFTLKVLENVDDLYFVHTDEIDFTVSELSPNIQTATISLDEDSNWSASLLSVNANEEIRVSWSILQEAENGKFSFKIGQNGQITELVYLPNPHFHGSDKIILEASDNYTSTRAEIEFHVQSVEDPHFFYEFPENLVENEDEKFELFISYQDGDGLNTLQDIEFTGLPDWLKIEVYSSSEFMKTLRLHGEPTVEDIGVFNIFATIIDINGIRVRRDFALKVNFFNKPPVPVPDSISTSFTEDSYSENFPKKWINFFSVSDEETSSDELTWSIVSHPTNGNARINERGTELLYYPDANYSGGDSFTIGVMDRGGSNNSLPRQTIVPVSVNILQENDLPVFRSLPPSLSSSDNVYSTTWNDEKSYYYEIAVLDSDWPWQGQPSLSLKSSLPAWASWKNIGGGKAILSGSPKWFHQGNYSFSVVAKSGSDEIVQNFDLEIFVDDYPPRVQDLHDQIIYKKIQIFVLEDGSLDEIQNTVLGLKAFNPDKVAGETLRWLPFKAPSSGGEISLSSYTEDGGDFARISNFNYQIPENFNGIDRFSLVVDEGDRQTEVPFEINIKAIPDPPFFLEGSSIEIEVTQNSYFERLILATDPDFQSIDFKLLYPSSNAKWLTIKSENNDKLDPSVKIGGIVPVDFTSDSFTLIASDPTGRFALLEVNLSRKD